MAIADLIWYSTGE